MVIFEKTKSRAIEFADLLIKKRTKFKYRAPLRSDNVDEKTIETLSRSGLTQVFIGIESVVPRQLDYYNKRITPQQNHHAIKILNKYNIDSQIAIIWFDRNTTIEEIRANLEFTKNINPHNIHHFPNSMLQVIPQTSLQKKVTNEAYIQYDAERNAYNYKIKDPIVRQLYKACNSWVKKYYQLYQLLIRLRFDYWNQDEGFCNTSKGLYSQLKQAELDFFEDLVVNGSDEYEKKIEANTQDFKELLSKGLCLYDKVVDKAGPLYVDFRIK